jgi:glyoxylase-like metal-dependent hydrolase (beta-lactamase superfamily II)
VLLVPAGNASQWTGPTGNNTYLLTGARPALIDAGVGNAGHLEAIEAALKGVPLALLLVTHGHPDHVNGIPALRRRWPSLRVRNVPPDACRDGEVIEAGDTRLRAVHTPGHAPDHFCFVDQSSRDVYCGDLVRMGGTIVIPASGGGSLAQYLRSLHALRDLRPRRLLPGHGPIIKEPEPLIREYVRHREERESQIVEALGHGGATIGAIVDRVYGGIAPALARAAADTVRAHLDKLTDEGRAERRGDVWLIRA